MGFKNFFKNLGKAAQAKADQASERIEMDNAAEFSKQDIAKLKDDLATINGNLGSVKGEIHVLEGKTKSIRAKIEKHEADAIALNEAGNEELAIANCNEADRLEKQIEPLESALTLQRNLLADQKASRDELQAAISDAEADLVSIQAMADVATANEKLTAISTDSGTSALASLNARKEAMEKRMIKTAAVKDETSGANSVEAQTAKALAGGGSSRLARLTASKEN